MSNSRKRKEKSLMLDKRIVVVEAKVKEVGGKLGFKVEVEKNRAIGLAKG